MLCFMPTVAEFRAIVDECTKKAVLAAEEADMAATAKRPDWRCHLLYIAFQTLRAALK